MPAQRFGERQACTIVMRWQLTLKSNFSEDQTPFLETLPRNRSHSLRASFAGRIIAPSSKSGELTSSGKKILLMLAQRFGERQRNFCAAQVKCAKRNQINDERKIAYRGNEKRIQVLNSLPVCRTNPRPKRHAKLTARAAMVFEI